MSVKRLVDNSFAAMLSAIEVYNKPQMAYRDEVTIILIVNAWELALKATLRKARRSIFYPKRRGEPYRSIGIDDALRRVVSQGLWPKGVDTVAASANVQALTEYRDRAIHLYNVRGLGAVIYPFLQQNVLNYRDFILDRFGKDLADSITWQLLPLGAVAPADAIAFMKVDRGATMVAEVQQFIDELRRVMDVAEQAGGDMSRIATVYDIHLQSVKNMTSADLVVAISPTADGQMVLKKTDPNQTHPYSFSSLLKAANKKRRGRALTTFDLQAVAWKEDLRADTRFAWKHSNGSSHVWSGDAVAHLASLSDSYVDSVRTEYIARPR